MEAADDNQIAQTECVTFVIL